MFEKKSIHFSLKGDNKITYEMENLKKKDIKANKIYNVKS